jgi:hypothetical protein
MRNRVEGKFHMLFSINTCLKTNFVTYLEFFVLAVADKLLSKVGQFC